MTKLRAWWSHRQALDSRLAGQGSAAILEQTGWARSVGGMSPYLTLFSRGGLGRAAVDEAVAKLEIHELPSARGCTYVLPASDFALALILSQSVGEGEMKVARKLGVTDAEIDKLCDAILIALGQGPLDPEQIREAVGGAARSLGDPGKKKGLSTTLPVALGKLQTLAEIRRASTNGRLDQQRYRYSLWRPSPLNKSKLSPDEAYTELARRYFTWIGPATLAEFRWFSGLGVKAARAALAALKLESLEAGDERLMLPGDHQKLEAFQIPKEPQYVLTSGLDGLMLLRRDLNSMLTPEDRARSLLAGLADLEDHAILDRGRIVGLWQYDPDAQAIAWVSFVGKSAELEQAVERTAYFIKTELGDARSFSLDSPKSRIPRIQALRQANV